MSVVFLFTRFFLPRVTVSVLSIVESRELCYLGLILISSLQNSIVKLVKTRHIKNYDVMTYKLSQLSHDVQNFCSRCQRVELS